MEARHFLRLDTVREDGTREEVAIVDIVADNASRWPVARVGRVVQDSADCGFRSSGLRQHSVANCRVVVQVLFN